MIHTAHATLVARLDETALLLLGEFADLPPGSVMRAFARAVIVTRRSGVLDEELPAAVATLTRRLLLARTSGGQVGRRLLEQGRRWQSDLASA